MAEYYLKYPSLFADWTRPYRPPHTTLKRDSDPDLNKAGPPWGQPIPVSMQGAYRTLLVLMYSLRELF